MGTEMVAWGSHRFFMQQEFFRERQVASYNITVILPKILPTYNERVSIGSGE
jgi:hypothetical protein